jgi:thiopeptide-type bacteriocin biosynthesis protein
MTINNIAAVREEHILSVLAGTPLSIVASRAGVSPADLADALAAYRAAGQAGLAAALDESQHWYHVSIEFPEWDRAEYVMVEHVLPALVAAETTGQVSCWWYVRKAPHWRVRLGCSDLRTRADFGDTLDALVRGGAITAWRPGVYEPETVVFGGDTAMDIAHRLFHADSRAILDHLAGADAGRLQLRRRELSLLVCTALLRAARLDWHEQGDVWHRVSRLRPLPAGTPRERVAGVVPAARRLLATDITNALANAEPLAFARPWFDAFTRAGHQLGNAARDGILGRGLRDVLAHHVVFHWNRLGQPTRSQAILALAATEATIHA